MVEANNELSLDALSLADFKLPLRSEYITAGRVIFLRTNYFAMAINTDKKLSKYNVEIKAERKVRKNEQKKENKEEYTQEESRPGRKRRQAFAILFESKDFSDIKPGFATDYASTIITTRELKMGPNGSRAFSFLYRDIEDRTPRPNATRYTFTLTPAGIVPTTELLRYLASTTTDPSDVAGKADAIQALNIIMARTPNMKDGVFQSGQNKFYEFPRNPNNYLELGGGLIAVRGYYSSVRTSTLRTLLNLNSQASPFYPAWDVVRLVSSYGTRGTRWENVENFVEKLRVKTQYLKNKDGTTEVKIKTIVGFSHKFGQRPDKGKMKTFGNAQDDHLDAQSITFECDEYPQHSPISVQDYFLRKHNVRLNAPGAWVLNCGTEDKPMWIPPELCTVMPGQPFRGKLNALQTSLILKVAARGPAENARRIVGAGQEVIGFRDPSLAAFGVKVDPSMIVVVGRVLPAPPVIYGGDLALQTAQGAWNMRGKKFAKPKVVLKWSYLRLGDAVFTENHMKVFKGQLTAYGLGSEKPHGPAAGFRANLPGDEARNDVSIRSVMDTVVKAGVRMLLVALPSKDAVTYSRVKFWADVKFGKTLRALALALISNTLIFCQVFTLYVFSLVLAKSFRMANRKVMWMAEHNTMQMSPSSST